MKDSCDNGYKNYAAHCTSRSFSFFWLPSLLHSATGVGACLFACVLLCLRSSLDHREGFVGGLFEGLERTSAILGYPDL